MKILNLSNSDEDSDGISDNTEVYCNPWALKCHRDHLKKLGLLSPGSPPDSSLVRSSSSSQLTSQLLAPSKKQPQTYLLLENLVSTYKFPCVLDLKVGARQYADDVSAAKKARKIAKAQNTTSATLGLRLTGMQVLNYWISAPLFAVFPLVFEYSNNTSLFSKVYDHESDNYVCHNKYFGRSLNPDTFEDTIEDFFKCNEHLRTDIIDKVVATIEELISVLNRLDSYRFYTASILITYDGREQPLNYDVRVIDFAHSTHRGLRDQVVHEGPDSGFIQGLKSFLRILEKLLQKHHRD